MKRHSPLGVDAAQRRAGRKQLAHARLVALIRRAHFGADEVNRVLAALAHLADQDTGEFSANPS